LFLGHFIATLYQLLKFCSIQFHRFFPTKHLPLGLFYSWPFTWSWSVFYIYIWRCGTGWCRSCCDACKNSVSVATRKNNAF